MAPFDGKVLDMFKIIAAQSQKVRVVGLAESMLAIRCQWSLVLSAH